MNSVEIIFKGNLTEEDYAALVESSLWRNCPQCPARFRVEAGFTGPRSSKGPLYCSARCVEKAERANSLLIKTAPAGLKIDGWDL